MFAGSFDRIASFLQLISNKVVNQTVDLRCHNFVGEDDSPKARSVASMVKRIGDHHLEVWKQLGEGFWWEFAILKIQHNVPQI